MKAAVYYETGPPGVFRYEDIADPTCGPNEVLIEVRAVSIEGGDVLNRWHGPMASRPHIVGYQCAGQILEVGGEVTDRHPGDQVVAVVDYGSHASMVSAPAAATWIVPDGLDIESAACVPIPFGTADDCLFEFGHLRGAESVLVHAGAGGVGLAAIQLAKRAGATVLATASSDSKLERLKFYGMDVGINYSSSDFGRMVLQLTGGRGVDLVVDSVGGQTLQRSLECLVYRGRAVTVGNLGRDSSLVDARQIMRGSLSLTGVFFPAEMKGDRVPALVARHLEAVRDGALRVVIDRRFPLSEAEQAHAYIESKQAFGRVVLVP